jgi:Glycosyltransferase family 87
MSTSSPLLMPARWRSFWLLVGLPAALILSVGLAWHIRPATHRFRDLTQDWLSARCHFDGRSIYTRHSESVPRYLADSEGGDEWSVAINAHPPGSVLALLPLGLLPHDEAVLTWNLLSLAMLACAVWVVLGPWGLNCEWPYWLGAGCTLIASTPLAAQGATAQLNPLLVLLIALSWASERRGKELFAGGLLGLAAGIKLFPAFLLVYFVCTRRWRAVLAAGGTMALLHATAVLAFGSRDVLTYFQQVIPEVNTWRSAWLNCSLAGFWSRLFDVTDVGTRELFHAPPLARILTYASCGALTAAVARSAWRAKSREQRDLAFAAAVVAMLLVSPVTWDHSLLLLLVPVAILWYHIAKTAESQLLLAALLFVPTFVPACRLWQLMLEPVSLPVMNRLADPWRSVVALAIVTYCLLGLAALALFSQPLGDRRDIAV